MKYGKQLNEVLNLLPGETVIRELNGDCWGSYGMRHSQVSGKYTLTDQRILFRGGGVVDALRLVFAIPYSDISSMQKCNVAMVMPIGIKLTSKQDGYFYLSVTKRDNIMAFIQNRMSVHVE